MPNRTCVVFFASDIKNAEKKLKKLKETYTLKAKGGYDVRYMTKSDFEFTPVYMGMEEEGAVVEETAPKKEKSKDKSMDKGGKDRKGKKERKGRK